MDGFEMEIDSFNRTHRLPRNWGAAVKLSPKE